MTAEPSPGSVASTAGARERNALPLEAAQLRRLLRVAGLMVSELDLDAVLVQLLDAARDLTGAAYAAIGVLDERKRELERFVYVGIDEEDRQRIGPLPRGHGLLGELIRKPQPLRLADISQHRHSYGFPAEHPEMTTFVGVPLIIEGEVWGNLYLTQKGDGEEFSIDDQELLIVLADWAAIAIANARSHKVVGDRRSELEQAVRGLRATVDLSRELGAQAELPRVLELVAKRSRALVEAGACLILLPDGDTFVVAEAAGEAPADIVGRRLAARPSPAADALRSGVAERARGRVLAGFAELGVDGSEALLVPLHFRGRDVGVLAAFNHLTRGGPFGPDEELLLTSFATSAAAGISAVQARESEKLRLSLEASEQERRRWARELHDETLQELGALRLMQEGALQIDTVEAMRAALAAASAQVQSTIAGLEGLITELRPAALDQLGVQAALEPLVARLCDRNQLGVTLDIDLAYERGDEPHRPTPELETAIYRVVQEALNNVIKHAGAEQVRIAVEERSETVTVTVEDDGGGIDPDQPGEGFGLVGMRERVELAGGELVIGPGTNGGTRVTARLPVVRGAGAAD